MTQLQKQMPSLTHLDPLSLHPYLESHGSYVTRIDLFPQCIPMHIFHAIRWKRCIIGRH
ncbi:hypothetical protein MTR67_002675 [Solanum verrucosum]|uniref:Uncharacterized protein n=1 Tax=Solanum verrucosum TaxID=315347 RepID=A0AAF0PSV9_SOLVR|nr:hypothetical protein MTR67_002675 [Solanum verrucosum]